MFCSYGVFLVFGQTFGFTEDFFRYLILYHFLVGCLFFANELTKPKDIMFQEDRDICRHQRIRKYCSKCEREREAEEDAFFENYK